jgi:hypothetical protein
MQIKTPMKYHLTSVEWLLYEKDESTTKGVEKREHCTLPVGT